MGLLDRTGRLSFKDFSQEYGALGDTQIDEAPANFDVKLVEKKLGSSEWSCTRKVFCFPGFNAETLEEQIMYSDNRASYL